MIGEIIIFIMILICIFMQIDQIRQYLFRRKMFNEIRLLDKHEEFERIYNEVMNTLDITKIKIDGIKKLLRKLLCYFFIGVGIVMPLITLDLYVKKSTSFNITDAANAGMDAITLGGIIVFFAIILIPRKTSKYKNEVIKSFITSINPEMSYDNNVKKYLYTGLYKQSGFKDSASDRTYITDCIEYELNCGDKVTMFDLHLQHHGYGRNSSISEVFEGMFAKITREKNIGNKILIERNKFIKGKNRIKSDMPGFELFFDLYAEDKNAADMMISNDIKEEILRLYQIYGIMFEISIKGNELFIRFFTGALFESAVFGTEISKRKLYKEYVIFTSILEIIKRINEIL